MPRPDTLPTWGTNTGSTILSTLNIDTITNQSAGRQRYTFSGSPDLSSVVVGHQLEVSGTTNEANSGTFAILAKDTGAYWIEVLNAAIVDATEDETGSPGTANVLSNSTLSQAPSLGKRLLGWIAREYPPANWLNWWMNLVGQWIGHYATSYGRALVGLSYVTSSAWSAIDGAGDPRASAVDTSASSWTGSADDDVYEDITGSDQTLTTGASRVLWLMTGQQTAYSNVNPHIKLLYGASTLVEIADSSGRANQAGSFTLFGLTPALTAGSNTIKAQMKRRSTRTISELRAAAIEMPATDGSGNTIQYAHITSNTAQTITDGAGYVTLTDYTQSLNYGAASKVLVLGSVSCEGIAANPVLALRVRNTTDNVSLGEEMEFTHVNTALKSNEQGFIRFARLYDLGSGGSKTLVTQMRTQGNDLRVLSAITSDAIGGQFCLIELPETMGDKTPVLYSTNIASDTTTSATAEELHTSPSQTFNGAPCLFYLSGVFGTSANGQVGYLQFQVDGVNVGEEQEFRILAASSGSRPIMASFPHTPAAGAHTVGVVFRTSTGTMTISDAQFGVVEFLTDDPQAGDAAEVELADNTGNPVTLTYSGVYNSSAGAQVGLRFTKDGAPLSPEFVFDPDNTEHPFTITVTDDDPAAAGADPVYAVEAKVASGTLTLKQGEMTAKEFAA